MYDPWPHQEKAVNEVLSNFNNGINRQVVIIPTRGGKSWVAASFIKHFQPQGAVYFIGHTNILITQMSGDLKEHQVKHGILAPWAPQIKYRVQVCSKDTLFNRMKKLRATGWPEPVLIVIDETHLVKGNRYHDIVKMCPNSKIIGLTATLCRSDNKGFEDIYQTIVMGPQRQYLIDNKMLAPTETFVAMFDRSSLKKSRGDFNMKDAAQKLSKPAILKDIVRHWEQKANGLKTLTFCASIDHAEMIAKEFTDSGHTSVAVSSKDGKDGIKEKLNDYYAGKYINLVSVDLFIMGFSVKECACIIQARPTKSPMVYLQTIGRGGIYMPGKVLINLDMVGNCLDPELGDPDADRDWSLDGKGKLREVSQLKRCPECLHPIPISERKCRHCGFLWAEREGIGERSRIPEEQEGVLISIRDVDRKDKNKLTIEIARNARDLRSAIRIAKKNGFDHRAGFHIWHQVLNNSVDRKTVNC
jgi:DNA repair protein RadD